MAFGRLSRREPGPGIQGRGGPMSDINMTPLIDVLRRKPLPRSVAGEPIGELFAAIRGDIPHAGSHFDYACPLTELVNTGVLAIRSGKTIEWDSANMKVKDAPEFDALIKEPVRDGWSYGEDLWKA
jgi:hypothetical protein